MSLDLPAERHQRVRAVRVAERGVRLGGDVRGVALLPFRDQVLALAHQAAETGIALGPACGHLRQRACGLRTLRPLRRRERLGGQTCIGGRPSWGKPVQHLDEPEKSVTKSSRLIRNFCQRTPGDHVAPLRALDGESGAAPPEERPRRPG